MDYVKERKSVPLFRVTMEMLTADMILSFLTNLEDERGCSEATRNNRCSAIRAFLDVIVGKRVDNGKKGAIEVTQAKSVNYDS